MSRKLSDTVPDFTQDSTEGPLPTLDDEIAKALFPKGWKTQKPCLRVVGQPVLRELQAR